MMEMKRTIYILLFCLFGITGMSQTVDLMNLYTDKDCYLAGEKLWVKVCVNDDAYPGNVMSRVAYVEICDTAQVHAQAKIALHQGIGWACIRLPQTMHSGMYQMTAYTRYMRNLKQECFSRKYVAVLNTLRASEYDNLKKEDVSMSSHEETSLVRGMLKGDKEVYGLREKVLLSWSSRLNAKDLTLSVVRKDCEARMPKVESVAPVLAEGEHWIAECEGHIVTGRVEGTDIPDALLAQLSCVGKKVKTFEGKRLHDLFHFYTYGVNGQQDIVFSAHSYEGEAYRMKLETSFAESLPQHLPDLTCQYEESSLVARSVALQLEQAMPEVVSPKEMEEKIFNQLPSKTYNLDEYVRFNTVQECFTEFVMGVGIDKEGDRKVIRMLQETDKAYNLFPVLVLIDGVAFNDHSEVLGYNARQIHYIHQYRGNYTLGETMYGGILSLITHRGTMPDMRINAQMQMLSYEFPQDCPSFDMPIYDNVEKKQNRKPDFRHTLYWNPSLKGQHTAEFYTSDLEGFYVAVLQGVTEDGKEIDLRWEFEVR